MIDDNFGIIAGLVILILIATSFLIWPIYNVWVSEQDGKAELARADYSKRVAVVEAQAKYDSAELLADAEVRRSKGVAEANRIIGESLRGHTEYLQYLWITQLEKSTHETIYVPTETQLPILEANRFNKR